MSPREFELDEALDKYEKEKEETKKAGGVEAEQKEFETARKEKKLRKPGSVSRFFNQFGIGKYWERLNDYYEQEERMEKEEAEKAASKETAGDVKAAAEEKVGAIKAEGAEMPKKIEASAARAGAKAEEAAPIVAEAKVEEAQIEQEAEAAQTNLDEEIKVFLAEPENEELEKMVQVREFGGVKREKVEGVDKVKADMQPWAQAEQGFDKKVKEALLRNPVLDSKPSKYKVGSRVLILGPGHDGNTVEVEIKKSRAGIYLAQFDVGDGTFRPVVLAENEIQPGKVRGEKGTKVEVKKIKAEEPLAWEEAEEPAVTKEARKRAVPSPEAVKAVDVLEEEVEEPVEEEMEKAKVKPAFLKKKKIQAGPPSIKEIKSVEVLGEEVIGAEPLTPWGKVEPATISKTERKKIEIGRWEPKISAEFKAHEPELFSEMEKTFFVKGEKGSKARLERMLNSLEKVGHAYVAQKTAKEISAQDEKALKKWIAETKGAIDVLKQAPEMKPTKVIELKEGKPVKRKTA